MIETDFTEREISLPDVMQVLTLKWNGHSFVVFLVELYCYTMKCGR